MSWSTLASNQMVSYTDAQGGGFTLNAGQSSVTSDQCMTKTDALAKYSLNATNMSTYGALQLVPKSAWVNGVTLPYYYGNGPLSSYTAVTNVNVLYPTTVSAGDLLVMAVFYHPATVGGVPTPAGWSKPFNGLNAGNLGGFYQMFFKIAVGNEGGTNLNLNIGTSVSIQTQMYVIKSSLQSNSVVENHEYDIAYNDTSITVNPTLNTTVAGELALAVIMTKGFNNQSSFTATGWTQHISTGGAVASFSVWSYPLPTLGTRASSITVNLSGATYGQLNIFQIKPV